MAENGPRGSECKCSPCGQTFTGLTLFDRHQDVDYHRPRMSMIRCLDPAGLGMVQDAGGTWGTPAGLASRERSVTNLARARSERTMR